MNRYRVLRPPAIGLGIFRRWQCLLSVLAVAVAVGKDATDGISARNATVAAFFAEPDIRVIELEVVDKDMEILRQAQWVPGPQAERKKVSATVREGGAVWTNVSVQLKGAAGSFRSVDDKPALTLHFGRTVKSQRFHGLAKLSLNNSVQDPTYLSEQFCRELFLKAGIPTPRATQARVRLNGRDLGLYVLVEGWDREFIQRHFKNAKGNLYDGGFIKDVSDELSTNSGEDPKDQSDRIALAEAAKAANSTNGFARLEAVLDLDRFLTFMAMDVMVWNWDGYAMQRNNWRLFHDKSTDKMIFMPHGLDQMFWKPEGTILPSVSGLVAVPVVEIPELRRRYLDRVRELRRTVFDTGVMTNRIREIASRIKPALALADPESSERHDQLVTDFCNAVVKRAESLDRQLEFSTKPIPFDASGAAALSGWKTSADFGSPKFSPAPERDLGGALQIGSGDGSAVGSWRTGVVLERGRYRVESRVRTHGVIPDPGDTRGGAGLRVRSMRSESRVTGDTDWTPVMLEFQIREPLSEAQIVCEFRGVEGEAWFDLNSIRLRRLDKN